MIDAIDFGQPKNIKAYLSDRHGGVSAQSHGRFASLNLGTHVGDELNNVLQNRVLVAAQIGHPITWLNQVHGTCVHEWDGQQSVSADAQVTSLPNVALAIMVADCLPVLFASQNGERIAAAHAGWRGLAAGVLENTVRALAQPVSQLSVYFGPCIGPLCFEVGGEVRAAFPEARQFFKANGEKYLADLHGIARARLIALGVKSHNILTDPRCTVLSEEFFSHRRDRVSGRQAVFIVKES